MFYLCHAPQFLFHKCFKSVPLLRVDPVDGVIIFVPKIIIKKADCGTLIQKLWQTNLHGGKTPTPPGGFILNVDSYVLLFQLFDKNNPKKKKSFQILNEVMFKSKGHLKVQSNHGASYMCSNFLIEKQKFHVEDCLLCFYKSF